MARAPYLTLAAITAAALLIGSFFIWSSQARSVQNGSRLAGSAQRLCTDKAGRGYSVGAMMKEDGRIKRCDESGWSEVQSSR